MGTPPCRIVAPHCSSDTNQLRLISASTDEAVVWLHIMERDLELGKQAHHAFSLLALLPCCDVMNCRIHHVMLPWQLLTYLVNVGQNVLESVTTLLSTFFSCFLMFLLPI